MRCAFVETHPLLESSVTFGLTSEIESKLLKQYLFIIFEKNRFPFDFMLNIVTPGSA